MRLFDSRPRTPTHPPWNTCVNDIDHTMRLLKWLTRHTHPTMWQPEHTLHHRIIAVQHINRIASAHTHTHTSAYRNCYPSHSYYGVCHMNGFIWMAGSFAQLSIVIFGPRIAIKTVVFLSYLLMCGLHWLLGNRKGCNWEHIRPTWGVIGHICIQHRRCLFVWMETSINDIWNSQNTSYYECSSHSSKTFSQTPLERERERERKYVIVNQSVQSVYRSQNAQQMLFSLIKWYNLEIPYKEGSLIWGSN